MIKSFAVRAIVPVALSITGFVILGCLVLYSFLRTDLENFSLRRQQELADTVMQAAHYSMLKGDRANLADMVRQIGRRQGVTHLRIFNKKSMTITFSADPTEVGTPLDRTAGGCIQCHTGTTPRETLGPMEQARHYRDKQGRMEVGITVPIPNRQECSSAACHAHDSGERVLGTLDIGLSLRPLEETLAAVRIEMAVFCLMILILSIGGVSALLWRNVFAPIKELVIFAHENTRDPSGGDPHAGEEDLEAIVGSLKEMAERCREPIVKRNGENRDNSGTGSANGAAYRKE
jgi:nitrate reductase cytochrome c-type subunit